VTIVTGIRICVCHGMRLMIVERTDGSDELMYDVLCDVSLYG
jgi:hypothetical protein